jgi:hypothetical protein
MIYYQLSGCELHDGPEDYLPDQEGITYFFYVKFTKEQPVEKLKLIFIDLLNAEYNKDGFSNCNPNRIIFHNIVKSSSLMEEVKID